MALYNYIYIYILTVGITTLAKPLKNIPLLPTRWCQRATRHRRVRTSLWRPSMHCLAGDRHHV